MSCPLPLKILSRPLNLSEVPTSYITKALRQMEKDILLKQRIGNANPFRVPDGYFKAFNTKMMDRLPERERGAVLLGWHKYRLLLCAAAIVCGLVFGVSVFLNHYEHRDTPVSPRPMR